MPDKSKMTVADILAAARKTDSPGGPPAKSDGDGAQQDTSATQSAPAAEPAAPPAEQSAEPAKKPAPATKPGGGKLSVAEMLAAARAEKQGGAAAPPAAPAKEKPAAKPAAKATPAKKSPAAVKEAPLETQSILAAARKGAKPGPMTKAEAQAKATATAPAAKKAKAKEAIVVPPMPVKPDYAKPRPEKPSKAEIAERRAFLFGISALALGFGALAFTMGAWTLAAVRFMFPNILREPPSRFLVGTPDKRRTVQVEVGQWWDHA